MVLCSDRTSVTSRDLPQMSHNCEAEQTIMAQLWSTDQSQADKESNGGQTQTSQGSSDLQKARAEENNQFNNNCDTTPSGPLLATGKSRRPGRVEDWMWEIASMILVMCCLVAIFVTLAKFIYQEQPNWPYASTLNLSTLIALFATVLRSMLENVLAAGQCNFHFMVFFL